MGHRGPFDVAHMLDVLVDEATEPCLRLAGEGRGQDDDGAKCAGFVVDRRAGAVEIAPDLGGDEGDEQPEDDAQRREEPGGYRLEGAPGRPWPVP